MHYTIKEIYYTLQGEGVNTGRPAVFCRFSGCNLWTGREADRGSAVCRFCDTDFVGTDGLGGGQFPRGLDVARAAAAHWPMSVAGATGLPRPLVVCTGGEPLLQMDRGLVIALHDEGFEIALETNGTILPPDGIDWICVSPKAGAGLALRSGQELKLVFPQKGAEPGLYEGLDFEYFLLQPMDGPDRERNTRLALRYCLDHPKWRLGLQMHKLVGFP